MDFILALIKESDWLKDKSEEIYDKHKSEIWSSQITLQELMLYCYKNKVDPVGTTEESSKLIRITEVPMNYEKMLMVSHIMRRYGATPFDAMHAVAAKEDGQIISSDSIYDKIGFKRIKLED